MLVQSMSHIGREQKETYLYIHNVSDLMSVGSVNSCVHVQMQLWSQGSMFPTFYSVVAFSMYLLTDFWLCIIILVSN